MSLESWKAEFYPVRAREASGSEEAALEHSLQKWRGLSNDALRRHKVSVSQEFVGIECQDGEVLSFTGCTCALCVRNYHEDGDVSISPCLNCSLYRASGGVSCDDSSGPYAEFVDERDPKPMIAALEHAVIWLKQQKGA